MREVARDRFRGLAELLTCGMLFAFFSVTLCVLAPSLCSLDNLCKVEIGKVDVFLVGSVCLLLCFRRVTITRLELFINCINIMSVTVDAEYNASRLKESKRLVPM